MGLARVRHQSKAFAQADMLPDMRPVDHAGEQPASSPDGLHQQGGSSPEQQPPLLSSPDGSRGSDLSPGTQSPGSLGEVSEDDFLADEDADEAEVAPCWPACSSAQAVLRLSWCWCCLAPPAACSALGQQERSAKVPQPQGPRNRVEQQAMSSWRLCWPPGGGSQPQLAPSVRQQAAGISAEVVHARSCVEAATSAHRLQAQTGRPAAARWHGSCRTWAPGALSPQSEPGRVFLGLHMVSGLELQGWQLQRGVWMSPAVWQLYWLHAATAGGMAVLPRIQGSCKPGQDQSVPARQQNAAVGWAVSLHGACLAIRPSCRQAKQ